MSNFIFIEKNINVKPFLKELSKLDWGMVASFENVGGSKTPYGFLPLIMAVVPEGGNPKDTEYLQPTDAFKQSEVVLRYIFSKGITKLARAAYFKLPVGGGVNPHIDDGSYYLTKDRFHLSLQGTYKYTVGDETEIIKPGTFFWFDNKKEHSAENISNQERITFVFDSPHNVTNPQHKFRK